METPVLFRRLCATVLCLMLTTSPAVIAAAKAVLAGPSHAVAGDMVMLQGQHFTAGASYTIKTTVGKNSSQEPVTADSHGNLSYQLVTAAAGKYQLQVRDSRNRLVATSIVLVQPAGG